MQECISVFKLTFGVPVLDGKARGCSSRDGDRAIVQMPVWENEAGSKIRGMRAILSESEHHSTGVLAASDATCCPRLRKMGRSGLNSGYFAWMTAGKLQRALSVSLAEQVKKG